MRYFVRVVAAIAWAVLAPSLAYAQASITGVVKDTSGAVLPGVTVEASSPALIEKVRTIVTDDNGLYRIVDLRPGTYSVTFSLPGFTSVKREGIELTGSFTATINADMRVGGLEETITVTGETPIVDTQSIRRQTTLSSETLTTVPTARSWAATAVLIPGIVTQAGASADVQITPQMTVFGGMGGRSNEGRMQVDGLNTGAALNGGGVSTYVADISNAAEVVTTTSGGLGEAEVGGPTLSIVPRSGGNTVKGSVYLSGVSRGMVGSNYSEELRLRGLSTPGQLIRQWDFTGGVGGPIVKDRIWYYGTARDEGQHRTIPGIFPNLNAGDPTKWEYLPDTSKEARGAESFQLFSARFTVQATPRNKFNLHWDWQVPCNGAAFSDGADACRHQPDDAVMGSLGLGGLTATTSPETAGYLRTLVQNRQVTWSSPATNRLLLEAGLGTYVAKWGPFEPPGNPTRGLVRVTEQAARNGAVANLNYRSADWAENYDNPNTWRASMSYITGAHAMKFGYIGGLLREDIENHGNDLNLTYTFNTTTLRPDNAGNATLPRPSTLSQRLRPFLQKDRVEYTALYAQDQWTMGRLTLQGALRFDRAWSYSPEQTIGPTNYLATKLSFPKTPGVDAYKDLSPRGGAAFDVFGNSRTSLKVNFGKYLEPASNSNGNYSISNPIARIATTTTRTWTDNGTGGPGTPGYGDFVAQCDLTLVDANGECGRMNSPTFGTPVQTTANIDPAILNGWNVRPGDWQIGVSVQHQLMARISVEAGYFHRWLTNFTTTDNTAVTLADYTGFTLNAPADPRLPNGGNYPVSGLFNLTDAGFAKAATNNVTFSSNFGDQSQVYNGVLFNVSARAARGLNLTAGVNTGKTVVDVCDVRSQLPELTTVLNGTIGPTNPYCHIDPGFITKVTGLASYTIPKIDVLVAGTLRSDQGAPLRATWNAPKDVVSAALGRTATGAGTTVAVDLVEPGQVWGDRVNEIDVRFAKILKFGATRTHVGIDIFNVLNSDAILTYNQTFIPGGAWLAPTSVLTPRFVKLSAQIDF